MALGSFVGFRWETHNCGFWVGDPQFSALSTLPASALGGALLNEGEGRGTFLIRRGRNIVNIGTLFGCFGSRDANIVNGR